MDSIRKLSCLFIFIYDINLILSGATRSSIASGAVEGPATLPRAPRLSMVFNHRAFSL
jgi:hypothetical protein